MKIGLFGINVGACAEPDTLLKIGRAAEAVGFESVWTGEHVVLPDPQVAPSPSPPQTKFLSPAIALAFLAGSTTTLRLGTGIIILPQRNPAVLAKEFASLDYLSKGRLLFGLGAGYLKPEFQALGAPYHDRGKRTDEYIEAIVALWTQAKPEYKGDYVAFSGIDAQPRPVQKPHPPIIVGGMSAAALRRAAKYGNGWYGFATDLEATKLAIEGLRSATQRYDRSALGPLEISVTPPRPADPDTVRRYRDLGVERVISLNPGRTAEDQLAFVERIGPELVRAVG